MLTLQRIIEANRPSAYFGTREKWYVALTRHRDSGLIATSNWEVAISYFQAQLGPEGQGWAVERFTDWLIGWVDYLLIDPTDAKAMALAQEIQDSLENYPVLDEEHLGQLEWLAAQDYWSQLNPQKRIHWLRQSGYWRNYSFRQLRQLVAGQDMPCEFTEEVADLL